MSTNVPDGQTRPVSVPHLVLGIVFAGIAAIWFLGEATNADLPRTAVGFPLVLIGAGVIGLVAIFVNSRRRSRPTHDPAAYEAPGTTDDTVVIEEK
jgi:hypothetical protein